MRLRRVRRRAGVRTSSRLFATYAAASLIPVMVLGAVMWQGYRRDAAEQGRRQGLAQAAVIAEMAVAPALDGADLNAGLTGTELEDMRLATQLALFNGSVLRLRVRGFAGQVVFSDDGSTGGGVPTTDPDFRAATAGQSRVKVIGDHGSEVIRVVQPLVASASGQAIGVLELYLPYQGIAAQMRAQLTRFAQRVAGGLAALYLVLALLAGWTTRSLGRYAARQEYHASHDMLTGLPNRAAYRRHAEAILEVAARDGGHGAVVLLDLNRFKEVNDTLGHHAGDELLRVVSERMRAGLAEGDLLARLGGDEFAMLLPGRDVAQAVAVLTGIRARVAEELVLDGVPLNMEASFGVALYPEHGTDLQDLKMRADAAMYQGKRGTEDIVVYAGGATGHPHQWLKIQAELRHALERDELVLWYQPKVGLPSTEINGVEALVRWQHPERGLLPPGEFLPAAEHSGLIAPLTEWVLRRALADQAGWTATGRDWTLSVNVSARNLDAPGFVGYVAALLAETGARPDRLILEVTETALAGDADNAVRAVRELGALGVGISVDDFGTGYTSLSHLRGLPISEIKVDRAFVADVDHDPQSQAIVRSVIELAHGLGSRVTAEGVETTAIHAWLVEAGCDEGQGYLYGRPVPWPQVAVEPITERSLR
ncbi:diguanylate cyclase [Actinoplanes sp. SE50]|uniref:putative bifunctional diguanylate cyclase/phosphodiesterase n=1 Tax=unclassified Actinoplanes TaxID=2626549 RepID=UPI00023ECA6C|nr:MULTISPECIES: EAL domain-containing protein [unclassified Actinoplanes]AEV81512.1 Phytochrome-like protein cph2 [Actinoplanes sp. SE50/110]ATO79915.1 diguanylate cyclase [Actinoplanes sp. SE50]SLL97317.1 diguanylate cyclase [Actinoplanes sp. SE50/110]